MVEPSMPGDPELDINSEFRSPASDGESSHCEQVMDSLLKAEMGLVGIASALGMIANILVLCVLLSRRSLLHLSAVCVINIVLADMLTLFTGVIDVLVNAQDSWTFSAVLCKVRSALAIMCPLASSAMLMAISGNCFLEACNHGVSPGERLRLLRSVCNVAWSVSVIFGLPTFLQSEIYKEVIGERIYCVSLPFSEDTNPSQALRLIYMFLVCWLPLATNWAFFVLGVLWRGNENVIHTATRKVKPSCRWRLPLSLTLAFTFCQLPFWLPYLVNEFISTPLSVLVATFSLPFINAAINPVLCIYFKGDLLHDEDEGEETQMCYEALSLKSLSGVSLK